MSLRKANPIREGREKAHVAPKIMIGDLGEGFFFFFFPKFKVTASTLFMAFYYSSDYGTHRTASSTVNRN